MTTKTKKKDRVLLEINNRKLRNAMNKLAKKQDRTLIYMIELAFSECIEKYSDKPA